MVKISAISVIITLLATTIMAQEVMDTAGIKDLVTNYQKVLNTRNTKDLAKFFSEDGDMVFGNFAVARGREEIAAWWQNYFSRQEKERRGRFDITSITFLTPVAALVNIVSTTGIADDTSTFRKARGTWVVHKTDSKWMIVAMRGMPTTQDRVELGSSIETAERLRPQIRAYVAEYEDIFNQHDAEALSKFFADDADIIVREQHTVQGAEAIKDYWENYFSQPRPYRAIFVIDDIRMLSDDVAIINLTAIGAAFGIQDRLVPTRQAFGTWVIVLKKGKWHIAALRVLPGKDDKIIRN